MAESLDFAVKVISGAVKPSAADALAYATDLQDQDKFDLARQVLAAVDVQPGHADYARVKQQLALSTYKDKDLPSPHRLHESLDILRQAFDLDTTEDCETLGLAGAIYKLLWHDGGQRVQIEKSYSFYRRAHDLNPADDGYVSVNAAYLLDVLASQEAEGIAPLQSEDVERRFAEAAEIRTEVIARLEAQGRPAKPDPKDAWWYWASLGEAALGVGRYAESEKWLTLGMAITPPPQRWMVETTSRQLAAVVRIQEKRKPAARDSARGVLRNALGLTEDALNSVFIGKVGLALSGGGFRASLYHIGVLAKLAELDVLRHVEVLSCVSGGSILGAAYYVGLKKRLEEKPVLSRNDYVEIVQELEREFLSGVQRNIRTRIGSSPLASLKMAFVPGYTRTTRTGELYENLLYKRIDGVGSRPIDQLLVKPAGSPNFNLKNDNWQRGSKVPQLVLNATALNSGHNWQFTATWMGESPQAIGAAIDTIPRLRRLWYDDDTVPKKWHHVPLGAAVGASAAVPGIFEPIVVDNLYPDHTVRLADGGVHDNQGLASLLEQSCKVILVSDASGQMEEQPYPAGDVAGVFARTNSVLQARVREAQYNDLQTRHRSGAIDGMMFIHLTKDLESEPISWIDAVDQALKTKPTGPYTSYGVDRVIQKELAEVRTDLDSFSDAEAYALMTSGYLMAERSFLVERCAPTIPLPPPASAHWRFLGARQALTDVTAKDNARMRWLLQASKMLALKVWTQSKVLKAAKGIGLAAVLIAVVAALIVFRTQPVFTGWRYPTYGQLGIGVILALALRYGTDKLLHIQKRFDEFFLGIGLLIAAPIVWLHLAVFDPIFLWIGEWKDAPPPAQPPTFAPPGSPRLPIKDRQRPLVWQALRKISPQVNKGETSRAAR